MLRIQRTPASIAPGLLGLYLGGVNDPVKLALFGASLFFLHLSANVVNDIADYRADLINAPDRPLASGLITKRSAYVAVLTLILIGLGLAYLVDWLIFLLALSFGMVIEVLYNFGLPLKDHPLGSALYLTLATSTIPFYAGIIVVRVITPATLAFGLLLALIVSSRVMSSLKDVDGDRVAGKKTVAVVLGVERTARLVAALYLLPLLFYPLPTFLFNFQPYYLYLAGIMAVLRVLMARFVLTDPSAPNVKQLVVPMRLVFVLDFVFLALARPEVRLE